MKYGKVTPGKKAGYPKKGLRLICCDCGPFARLSFRDARQKAVHDCLARRKTDPIRAQIIKVFGYQEGAGMSEVRPLFCECPARPCGR